MAFVDLEKAFDRFLCEVFWWALRCLGVDEWIVSVVRAMYKDATMTVKMNGRESKATSVRVGCIRARFSVHCCLSLYWRLGLKSLEKIINGVAVCR